MDTHPSGSALRSIRTLFGAGTVVGLTDGQLLERFAARDDDGAELAFAGLVERHGPMVLRVCRGILRDAHEAEDAFQATFLILALKAASIRGRDSLGPWLYRVAHNVATSARTSAARRRLHEERAAQERSVLQAEEAPDDLTPTIIEELDQLPERYRVVLVLCGLEGLTQDQAARRLGCPLGTVQSRLARGRERLRARLLRRGMAPTSALLASTSAARAAMPASLANSTVRLAMAIGAARSLAIGTIPGSVGDLARRVTKTFLVRQVLRVSAAVLLAAVTIAAGAAVHALPAAGPTPAVSEPPITPGREEPPADRGPENRLTVKGFVRMRDGSPVAGATVQTITGSDEEPVVSRTDEGGRFQVESMFGNGCTLHARSADGSYQAVLTVPSLATRDLPRTSLEITLLPALTQRVTVRAEGRPVAGARVAMVGIRFLVEDTTGPDGKARLRIPAKESLHRLVAWHPTLGIAGLDNLDERSREAEYTLSLLSPAPRVIRTVDTEGRPVSGLELGLSFRLEEVGWIVSSAIPACGVRTDANGKATVSWAPREKVEFVDVDLHHPDWKIDEIDRPTMESGSVTVHVRREVTVPGRLIMPEGTDATGILVSGFGFGPSGRGDIPYARALPDGTFHLRVPSEHGYVLGIDDLRWASDPWGGQILAKDSDRPAEIAIRVYPATPLTIKVTRGPAHEPVANAWVNLTSRGNVHWVDAAGKERSGNSGVRRWLRTDAHGVARAGVGRGEQNVRLSAGNWDEEQTITVTSEQPITVAFHRDWTGVKHVTGRLMQDGMPFVPSTSLVARAWATPSPRSSLLPPSFEPVVRPDGSYELTFDAESTTLVFLDPEKAQSGHAERVGGKSPLDVSMAPTASDSGMLLDENGRAMPGRTLTFRVKAGDRRDIATASTDRDGRFRFAALPSGVPLVLDITSQDNDPEYLIPDWNRLYQPGEVRDGDRVKLQVYIRRPPVVPLAQGVEDLCRNARATGMLALIALMGDGASRTVATVDQLFNIDEKASPEILRYVTLGLEHGQVRHEAAVIDGYGWARPGPGEVVLIALDGDQKVIATHRIATQSLKAAIGAAREFVKQHAPPPRDARAALAAARAEAMRSHCRVWLIVGGPRCGPCFRLARWIEEHHAALDRDYVVVKVMSGIDEHADEVIAGLPIRDGDGIPWYAITEPDGTILATSHGPLGNIGFPSSVEGIRHLRSMLERTARTLTPGELDRLIGSLSPKG